MKKYYKTHYKIILIILVLLFFIYTGHFFINLYKEKQSDYNKQHPPGNRYGQDTLDEETKYPGEPVIYSNKVEYIRDKGSGQENNNAIREVINILEIDLAHPEVAIRPVLSHDLVYGFEYLSDMASRKGAYAAINGGFYSQYGLPSGMVVIDGELMTMSTGKFPVFVVNKERAEFDLFESKLTALITTESTGGTTEEKSYFEIDRLNSPLQEGEIGVYTAVYGSSNRVEGENLTITVRRGVVKKIAIYQCETDIPRDGYLITFATPFEHLPHISSIEPGDLVSLKHSPDFIEKHTQAYECGSMIVKDGLPVIGEWDQWVGILTNRDPRTAVGIKEDGKVVLITVDGRQPGYSAGMTGRELADYLLSLGVVDAAMLDGGASTEMLVEGTLVNRPSFKGQERPLAGGILIHKN
jgi:hypothetical protein